MRQGTVSYYCNLDHPPRRHMLQHIADSFGVSIEDVLGEKGSGPIGKHLPAAILKHSDPFSRAAKDLKRRWKKTKERDAMKHLLAALFPDDVDQIVLWLNQK